MVKIIKNKKINITDDIDFKLDIDEEIKRFGTCIDEYGNDDYYYRVREDVIKMC